MFCCFYRPKRNAIFVVDLQIDHQGVHYSTPLPNFETSLLALFNKGIQSTQSVPQLEKVIIFVSYHYRVPYTSHRQFNALVFIFNVHNRVVLSLVVHHGGYLLVGNTSVGVCW